MAGGAGSGKLEAGSREREAGSREREAGSRELGAGSRELEGFRGGAGAGSQKSGYGEFLLTEGVEPTPMPMPKQKPANIYHMNINPRNRCINNDNWLDFSFNHFPGQRGLKTFLHRVSYEFGLFLKRI